MKVELTFAGEIRAKEPFKENPLLVAERIDALFLEASIVEAKLKMLAASNPSTLIPAEWEDEPITFISNQVDELFDTLNMVRHELYLLENYRAYLEKNGYGMVQRT